MDVNNNVNLKAGMFAFNKSKDIQNEKVLSALGMTPETQRAQKEIESSMKEEVAKSTGKGLNIDTQA